MEKEKILKPAQGRSIDMKIEDVFGGDLDQSMKLKEGIRVKTTKKMHFCLLFKVFHCRISQEPIFLTTVILKKFNQ